MTSTIVKTFLMMFVGISSAWSANLCSGNLKTSPQPSQLTSQQALAYFQELAKAEYRIPYLNSSHNCHNRAYRVSEVLKSKYKINTVRVFVEAKETEWVGAGASAYTNPGESNDGILLGATTVDGSYQSWARHTGTAVCVDGELQVFDHSLFRQPVSFNRWIQSMTQGLAATDYSIQIKNMHTLFWTGPQPKKFRQQDRQEVDWALKADWPLHQQLLNR